jgi:prolipoprotein diacylglyceryltransferase
MLPFLFDIFGFRIFSYGMGMVFAFIICITITLKFRPQGLLSSQDVYNFCLFIMASLLFGTKLMGIILETRKFFIFPRFLIGSCFDFNLLQNQKEITIESDGLSIANCHIGGSHSALLWLFPGRLLLWKTHQLAMGNDFPRSLKSRQALSRHQDSPHPVVLWYHRAVDLHFSYMV